MHSATPILPFCNYYDNHVDKVNECNIPSKDLFCDYCGKEGHQEVVYFAKFPEWKQLWLPWKNLPTYSIALQPKAKAPPPSIWAFPAKGNSNKNVKKNEHNVDKEEVFQAHVAQIVNLKCKSFQPASHSQPIQNSGSQEGPPKLFYGLSHNAMVKEYVFSNAHNYSLTLEFATSFCPSYFAA